MEDLDELLQQIEEEIQAGKRSLFGGGVLVNGDRILSAVDKIRLNLPDIIREAKLIVQTSEKRRFEETQRAQSIVSSAQQRADEILSDHNIIKQAEREAEAIRAQAQDYKTRVVQSVKNDLGVTLAEAEGALLEALRIIQLAERGTK